MYILESICVYSSGLLRFLCIYVYIYILLLDFLQELPVSFSVSVFNTQGEQFHNWMCPWDLNHPPPVANHHQTLLSLGLTSSFWCIMLVSSDSHYTLLNPGLMSSYWCIKLVTAVARGYKFFWASEILAIVLLLFRWISSNNLQGMTKYTILRKGWP